MKIDNFTRDYRTAQISTTTAGGVNLIHARDCRIYTVSTMGMVDFANCCDCFVSQITEITLPDGTPATVPGDVLKEIEDAQFEAGFWRRRAYIALILGAAGWLFSLARGIWGF